MFLDCGTKPEYLERTIYAWGEHANSTQKGSRWYSEQEPPCCEGDSANHHAALQMKRAAMNMNTKQTASHMLYNPHSSICTHKLPIHFM